MTIADEPAQHDTGRSRLRPSGESSFARLGLGGFDVAVLASAALLIVAYAPFLAFDAWTPRMAVVLAWVPIGVWLLAQRARARDVAAMWLVAALSVIALSALVSGDAWATLFGVVGRDLSVVMLVGAAGLWAAARSLSDRGREFLPAVVIWAAGASAVVGVLQVLVEPERGALALQSGRPTGLVVNPVYFGALSAMGALIASSRWPASARRPGLAVAIVLFAATTALSGSRVALAALILVAVALVVSRRDRSSLWPTGLTVVGVVAGVVLDRAVGAGRNSADRLTAGGGGGRGTVWRYAVDAVFERPLLGHGIGRFRAVVQDDFSVPFVREAARDELRQAWFDPHNAGLLLLVGTGVVGTILVLGWLVAAGRRCDGPLAWGAATLALTWTLQPVALATLPIAMVMFGAAMRPEGGPPDHRGRTPVALAVLGTALLVYVTVVGALFERTVDAFDPDGAESIAALYPRDPTVGDVVAQLHDIDGDLERALEWRRKIVDWAPDRPLWWSRLAEVAVRAERFDEAEQAIARARTLQPHNLRTAQVEAALAARTDDVARLDTVFDEMCDLGDVSACDLDAAELLSPNEADGD